MNRKLPSQSFQPRLPPRGTRLISSTMFWPMSATNRLPFRSSQGEALRVAHAVGVDLAEGAVGPGAGEGIVGGDAVLPVGAVRAERIDAQNLAQDRAEILREVQRIPAAAAVRRPDVEEPEVGIAGRREGIEAELPAVVVAERLLHTQQFPRQAAVVDRGGRIRSGPLQQDGVLRVGTAVRHEVRRPPDVARIGVGVELPEARRARSPELRMHREALEPPLAPRRLDGEPPAWFREIEVLRDRFAVVADGVDETRHIVHEEASRARLVDQPHHPAATGRRRTAARRTPPRRP